MEDINHIIENTLVTYACFETGLARLRQCIDNSYGASEPVCIAVIGESRAGKSRLLEECLLAYPSSRSKEGMSVPVLQVKAPSKPTVKGLVELLLYAMQDPMYDKGTEYTKTIRLKTLMKNAGTSVVVIDEFQHFVDKVSEKVIHHVADWLKILVDDCHVASIHVLATMVTGSAEGFDEDDEGPRDVVSSYQYREVVQRTDDGLITLFTERRHDPIFDQ